MDENVVVMPVDSYRFMVDCLEELKKLFDATDDPMTIIRISTEVRGLHAMLETIDPEKVRNKRLGHRLSVLIRKIETDEKIPESAREYIIEELKGVAR